MEPAQGVQADCVEDCDVLEDCADGAGAEASLPTLAAAYNTEGNHTSKGNATGAEAKRRCESEDVRQRRRRLKTDEAGR